MLLKAKTSDIIALDLCFGYFFHCSRFFQFFCQVENLHRKCGWGSFSALKKLKTAKTLCAQCWNGLLEFYLFALGKWVALMKTLAESVGCSR